MLKEQVDKAKLLNALEGFTETECRGVDSLLTQWGESKRGLYALLGNKLKIEKKIKASKTNDEIWSEVNNFIRENRDLVNYSLERAINRCNSTDFVKNICEYHEWDIPDEAKSFYRRGMKLSNFFRHFIDDVPNYTETNGKSKSKREWFDIQFSKLIQNLKTDGMMVISIDPLDYLTMSVTNSGWRSCHHGYDGEYRAGCLSYMVDETSVVAYIYNGKESEYNFNGKSFIHNSKNWRQMVFINIEDKGAVFSRQYPRNDIIILKEVIDLVGNQLATYHNSPAEWQLSESENDIAETICDCEDHLHYSDIGGGYNAHKITLYGADDCWSVQVGDYPKCCVCGRGHVNDREELACDDCKKTQICSICEDRVSDDYVRYDNDGEVYCESCYHDNHSMCNCCRNYVVSCNTIPDRDGEAICDTCRDSYYSECDLCGGWARRRSVETLSNGNTICNRCSDEYVRCGDCGVLLADEDSHDGRCSNCNDDYLDDCRAEEEEEEARREIAAELEED